MNQQQMVIELSRTIGGKFLGLTTVTEVKMNKTNGERKAAFKRLNPFDGKVVAVRNSTFQPNYDYAKAVNKAQAKTGNGDGESFEAGETWYNRIEDAQGRMTPFAEHKTNGSLYFVGRELTKGESTYIANEDIMELSDEIGSPETGVTLYFAGDVVPYAAFSSFMPPYKPSAKQGLSESDEIKPRTLKFESIWGMKQGGERETVDPTPTRIAPTEVIRAVNDIMAQMPDINIESID